MSYADPALIQARNYLMSRGIPGNALGIVGDQSHQSSGGYHVGNDVLAQIGKLNSDYSKRQTDKDRPGSNAAMALDIGGLSGQALYELTAWLIAQCRAGTADTRNIREVIGRKSPAGGIVHYDALGLQTGLPPGHDTHTHISYYRDSEGGDKTSLFRRYYEPAPTAAPSTPQEEDAMRMFKAGGADGKIAYALVQGFDARVYRRDELGNNDSERDAAANVFSQVCGQAAIDCSGDAWNALMKAYAVRGHNFVRRPADSEWVLELRMPA